MYYCHADFCATVPVRNHCTQNLGMPRWLSFHEILIIPGASCLISYEVLQLMFACLKTRVDCKMYIVLIF